MPTTDDFPAQTLVSARQRTRSPSYRTFEKQSADRLLVPRARVDVRTPRLTYLDPGRKCQRKRAVNFPHAQRIHMADMALVVATNQLLNKDSIAWLIMVSIRGESNSACWSHPSLPDPRRRKGWCPNSARRNPSCASLQDTAARRTRRTPFRSIPRTARRASANGRVSTLEFPIHLCPPPDQKSNPPMVHSSDAQPEPAS